jgi:hypothetical protein
MVMARLAEAGNCGYKQNDGENFSNVSVVRKLEFVKAEA